jgi:hypothetical protein
MSDKPAEIKNYLKALTVPLGEMISSCDKIINNISATDIDEFKQITTTIEKKSNENETYKNNEKSNTGKLINMLYQSPKQGARGFYNLGAGLFGTVGLVAGAATAGAVGLTAGVLGGVAGAATGAAGYNDTGMLYGAEKGARFVTPVSKFTMTRTKPKPPVSVGGGKKTKKHNKHKKTEKRQKRQKRHKKQKTYKN